MNEELLTLQQNKLEMVVNTKKVDNLIGLLVKNDELRTIFFTKANKTVLPWQDGHNGRKQRKNLLGDIVADGQTSYEQCLDADKALIRAGYILINE